ncbi:hypothetical protein PENSPDRAFT_684714 [Peniophora sp. CONT]|nr:hypothetical protein PENSPDRAFT_684714 [Peniophora sp. CONT]
MSRYMSPPSAQAAASARDEDVMPPQTQPADFTLYYDADETASEFPAPFLSTSTPSGVSRRAKAASVSPTTPRTTVSARRHSYNSRNQPVSSSLNVWAAAAESPRERMSFDRASLPSIPDELLSTSPRSTNSDLADISSNLVESSDEDSPSPVTPLYDELLRPDVASSSRIQDERDAALRALENKDPVQARNSISVSDHVVDTAASPSFPFGSPRPTQELPSLTNSLSTVETSALRTNPPTSRFSSMLDDGGTVDELRDFDISPSVAEVHATSSSMIIPRRASYRSALGIDLSGARSYRPRSDFVLDLVEPSSPDSANFSPSTEIITFASPDVTQLELRFPGFHDDGERPMRVEDDRESMHSHDTSPPHAVYGTPRTPVHETPHTPRITHDLDDTRLEASKSDPPRKASLFSKFKTIKTKVRQIFTGHNANVSTRSRADSMASELVSPNTPSYLVSLQLPRGLSNAASPASRGRSVDLESLQQPAFTLTDAPGSAPAPRGTRFATVTPVSEPTHRRSRRFSLQPSFFSRARSNSRATARQASPSGTHLGVPDDEEAARVRHSSLHPFNINADHAELLETPAGQTLQAEDSLKLDAPFEERSTPQRLTVGRDETARERRRSTGVLGLDPRASRNIRKRLSAISTAR